MKYLIELQQEVTRILHKFIENEPEDNEEYNKLLKIKQDIDYYIASKKASDSQV